MNSIVENAKYRLAIHFGDSLYINQVLNEKYIATHLNGNSVKVSIKRGIGCTEYHLFRINNKTGDTDKHRVKHYILTSNNLIKDLLFDKVRRLLAGEKLND